MVLFYNIIGQKSSDLDGLVVCWFTTEEGCQKVYRYLKHFIQRKRMLQTNLNCGITLVILLLTSVENISDSTTPQKSIDDSASSKNKLGLSPR